MHDLRSTLIAIPVPIFAVSVFGTGAMLASFLLIGGALATHLVQRLPSVLHCAKMESPA